jgi:hypothetical protein
MFIVEQGSQPIIISKKLFFCVNLKNVWTSNKKQQNECVLWNKGLNHKQKLCELQKWYGHQTNKKQQNKTKCVLWSKGFFTIGKSYVS